jgi:hypothetical protein
VATAIALAIAVMYVVTISVSAAHAGTWMEVSCENPDQSAAPSENWSASEKGGGFGSNAAATCSPGRPMYAILSSAEAASVGDHQVVYYTPPAGSTLIGGSLDVTFFSDGFGFDAYGNAVVYSPESAYNGSNVAFQCAVSPSLCTSGKGFSSVFEIPANRGGNVYVSAECGGVAGQVCNEGGSEGAWALARIYWARLLLSNEATPSATNIGGTLLNANVEGPADVTFNAADTGGPGVYRVVVEIDGKTAYSGTPDNNHWKCLSEGMNSGAMMFDYAQPCPEHESVDVPINTADLANGQHTLKVLVEDAAGNSAVVYDAGISTNQSASGSLGGEPGPGAGAGTPNGTTPDANATVTLGIARQLTRGYQRRALVIPGRLVDSKGRAIAGATVDVLQRVDGSPTTVVAHARTAGNGTFEAHVPAGASRRITLAYRAWSSESGYSVQATVQESVRAGVQLTLSRKRGAHETITLKGRVDGPVPRQGAIVDLLVFYRGSWQPFRTPQTKSNGEFEETYEFQGGEGVFPFRARVPGGQAGFPFREGLSRVVNWRTR